MAVATPSRSRPWADLEVGLITCIAACCELRDYASCRTVCGAWRSALPPPLSRPLAVLPADDAVGHPVSLAACPLHLRRWARLLHDGDVLHRPTSIRAAGCRCVGASRSGWLALVAGDATAPAGPLLFNPFTGEEIPLNPKLYEPLHGLAPKIVFSPNPTPRDFTAASLCRPDKVAVQRMSDGSSYTDDTGPLLGGAILADVAYGDDGKIYCLARDGEVHVLHLNRRRRACRRMPPIEVGPLPKLPIGADTFPPPYDIISQFTDAKNLVLCDGVLYQIWRRPSGAGSDTVDAPPGAASPRIHVFEGAVFVLRYDPGNWPNSPACWTVAEGKDLRGNAVFIGMNDAAVVPAGVEGLSDNSVYYWDGPRGGDYEAVIYNMTTGSSVRWPAASTGGVSSPVWYFLPAVESRRVEAETTDVETTSVQEAASPDHDEGEHDAHRLRKTMNLLGRSDYSIIYGNGIIRNRSM